MGSEVYTVDDKGSPRKASDAVTIAYQCDTEAQNFLTQSLPMLLTLLQELMGNSKCAHDM